MRARRKPPPSTVNGFGDIGPPVPGIGSVPRQREQEWRDTHPPVAHDNSTHEHQYYGPPLNPRQGPPGKQARRRRNSRQGDSYYAQQWRQPQVN